jgi:hypothetical protein
MKLKLTTTLSILTLSILLGGKSYAQDEFFNPRADAYFEAGNFNRAYAEYIKAYPKQKTNLSLLYRLAETILQTEMPRDTACFFIDKFIEKEPGETEAYYMGALAYYHAHNFSKASTHINKYLSLTKNKEDIAKAKTLQQWIANAERMVKKPTQLPIVNLGPTINTANQEINPYIFPDGKTLIFSCDDKYNSMAMLNYFNLKVSDNLGLNWSKCKEVTGTDINTLYDEYVAGITTDNVIFCSNRDVQFSLFQAERKGKGGKFGVAERFPQPIDFKGDEVAATLSVTGDTMIFTRTIENGLLDLFYSIKSRGSWGTPRPLPGQINQASSDENYPSFSPDGKRLYFASNRETSMGGYDIYYSDFNEKTKEWSAPVQMPYPINDTYDNMTISHTADGRYGYISSIRKDGYGGRDIYAIIYNDVTPTTALFKCFVGLKNGDEDPKKLSETPRITVYDETGEMVASLKVNMKKSTFLLSIGPGQYTINIDSPEAEPFKDKIEIPEKYFDKGDPISKKFILTPAVKK